MILPVPIVTEAKMPLIVTWYAHQWMWNTDPVLPRTQ